MFAKSLYVQKVDNSIIVGTENGFFPVLHCHAFSLFVGTGVATSILRFQLRGKLTSGYSQLGLLFDWQ